MLYKCWIQLVFIHNTSFTFHLGATYPFYTQLPTFTGAFIPLIKGFNHFTIIYFVEPCSFPIDTLVHGNSGS
jgi:hypothetical protein